MTGVDEAEHEALEKHVFTEGPDDAVIRLRGLPYQATVDDIVEVRRHSAHHTAHGTLMRGLIVLQGVRAARGQGQRAPGDGCGRACHWRRLRAAGLAPRYQ